MEEKKNHDKAGGTHCGSSRKGHLVKKTRKRSGFEVCSNQEKGGITVHNGDWEGGN